MKPAYKSPPPLPDGTFERVKVGELSVDRRNPRLVEYGVKPNSDEGEVIELLWNEMAVDELAMSIAASGFWGHEPLFVTEEDGDLVVIEGNRRLAAVKVLTNGKLRAKLRATDLPTLTDKQLADLRELPVVRVKKREDAWPYIGFKHVNGPQKWRSYPKAQYIAFVKKMTGAPLAKIAAQIGDRHGTVQELYRVLMVIEQAEAAGVYKRDFVKGRLAFSHLTTALEYPNFARFLDVKDVAEESEKPVSPKKLRELGEVCRWLWGDKRDDTDRVIASQNPNLRQLEQVLGNAAALSILRTSGDLQAGHNSIRGDVAVFAEALHEARLALAKAQRQMPSGQSSNREALQIAATVAVMANGLVDDIHDSRSRLSVNPT